MIISLNKFKKESGSGGGKPEEVFDVQPMIIDQTITPSEGSVFISGTVRAVTSTIDRNIQPENIKEGVRILGVEGTLKEETGVFVVSPEMGFGYSKFTEFPSNWDFREFSNVTDMGGLFYSCSNLTTIPLIDTSSATNASYMFSNCRSLTTIPPIDMSKARTVSYMFYKCGKLTAIPSLNTSSVQNMSYMFSGCTNLTTVEGIDFSGLTSDLTSLFGSTSNMPNLTHFIVNGKINVSMSDDYSIKALTAIDYDSVKSILTAASNTDNTNAKTLAFNRTMTDQNGELAALVTQCAAKGWAISGLTLN